MKNKILFLLLLSNILAVHSQKHSNYDSLKIKLNSAKSPIDRMEIYSTLYYKESKYESKLKFVDSINAIAIRTANKTYESIANKYRISDISCNCWIGLTLWQYHQ